MSFDLDAIRQNTVFQEFYTFGETESYDAMIDLHTPIAERPLAPLVGSSLTLPMNLWGSEGRPAGYRDTVQNTNLDVTPEDVLGSWQEGTLDWGLYVVGGEQIGIGGGLAMTGDYTGILLFGDFALRYNESLAGTTINGQTHSGLVLTVNMDFVDVIFADLVTASLQTSGSNLSISATMLFSAAVGMLGEGGETMNAVGLNFGTFEFNGTFVPEPASYALLLVCLCGGVFMARKRSLRRR